MTEPADNLHTVLNDAQRKEPRWPVVVCAAALTWAFVTLFFFRFEVSKLP